jgi:hypothetical protein
VTEHRNRSGAQPRAGRAGEGLLIALDTATTTAVVVLGDQSGRSRAESRWAAGYRHGEDLLTRIDGLLAEQRAAVADLTGVIVGTGPGAFTGLRVGLATAKGLAVGLGLPLVGVPTSQALMDAARRGLQAASSLALLVPAGPSDRVLVSDGSARLLPGGEEPDLEAGTLLVAVDLAGRAPDESIRLGERAVGGLAAALLRIGASRLAAGERDDVAQLVPEYVSLPRGISRISGEVSWSRGRP